MERFYDGDQEALFKAAHVINPYVVPKKEPKVSVNDLEKHLDSFKYFSFFSHCDITILLDFSLLDDGRL